MSITIRPVPRVGVLKSAQVVMVVTYFAQTLDKGYVLLGLTAHMTLSSIRHG